MAKNKQFSIVRVLGMFMVLGGGVGICIQPLVGIGVLLAGLFFVAFGD